MNFSTNSIESASNTGSVVMTQHLLQEISEGSIPLRRGTRRPLDGPTEA